ncbi:hypothetical protein A2767_00670 [Candidatus Roizmanbacteria bacterium RIFCSPHIGHO2_01_FULL_35_10]|uniref:Uncharacterized protein n=1 Tax=Candidatus Roizmanbacteria bacterium RIFCSPLOWO2_01_FULL_35_13 TaxID=1802055 RepID=A0A1F7I976_9BACT|nr:MAG: hypothetical protein A2767_00670 [Candidatus Roizmanbacteria bacterium RIFCSPHIGHO2_01_FULL_35_10]OGK39852.1 MAG: hypothetical protein A3A74_03095 [Candidatus Roizmanbacteria bacterium RIFCSPLOWO2_01_FULL_35_13]
MANKIIEEARSGFKKKVSSVTDSINDVKEGSDLRAEFEHFGINKKTLGIVALATGGVLAACAYPTYLVIRALIVP